MREIKLVVSRILDIFLGVPEDAVNLILPVTYESKKSHYTFMEIKNLKRVWGYGESFQYEGKNIKIIDLSTSWKHEKGFHKFKYVVVCDKIAIRVDDVMDIKGFFFKDIYAFPFYLQRLLGLEYIWGIAIDNGKPIYLIDPKILKCN